MCKLNYPALKKIVESKVWGVSFTRLTISRGGQVVKSSGSYPEYRGFKSHPRNQKFDTELKLWYNVGDNCFYTSVLRKGPSGKTTASDGVE